MRLRARIAGLLALAALTFVPQALAQPPEGLRATTFSRQLTWYTAPGSIVRAELRDAEGVRATAFGFAEDDGSIQLRLYPTETDFPGDPYMRPGDVLRISRFGDEPEEVTIPNLTADADAETDVVEGTAPPGTEVAVELIHGLDESGRLTETTVADEDGRFTLDLSGTVDLMPGDEGAARFYDEEDRLFTARFAVFRADIIIGATELQGEAAMGTQVGGQIETAGGTATLDETVEVVDSQYWSLPPYWSDLEIPPVEIGDSVTISHTGGPRAVDRTHTLTVPELAIQIDPTNPRSLSGTGPADTDLTVEARAPGERTVSASYSVTTDANGAFTLTLPDEADTGPGWRYVVANEVEPGVRVLASAVVDLARVRVNTREVEGVTQPGRRVTATLRAPDGLMKMRAADTADHAGDYRIRLYDTEATAPVIAAGDTIEIEFAPGDPLALMVPEVTAISDADEERVYGTAPAGATVRVKTSDGRFAQTLEAVADASGSYSVDMTDVLDVEPPMDGDVIVGDESGHAFVFKWSSVQMTVNASSGGLSGNGPPGAPVTAEVVDADGQIIATASGRVAFEGPMDENLERQPPQWSVTLDALTGGAGLETGDQLNVSVGDQDLALEVPLMEGTVFVEEDLVSGRTEPNVDILIRVQDGYTNEPVEQVVRSGDDGVFEHDFSDQVDIQNNDGASLWLGVGRHFVTHNLSVPGMTLNLDTSGLGGDWRPDTTLEIALRTQTTIKLSRTVNTGAVGGFGVTLQEGDVGPEPGDLITVTPEGEVEPVLRMTVPELTIEWDRETQEVFGRTTPGGRLDLFTFAAFMRFDKVLHSLAVAEIQPDGTYTAPFIPAVDVIPGLVITGWYRTPAGHLATRRRTVPAVNVQHTGSSVCGYASPGDPVEATLRDADGNLRATANGTVGGGGAFDLALRDDEGARVATSGDETVSVTMGQITADIELPALLINTDWDNLEVRGKGPFDSDYYITQAPGGCFPGLVTSGAGTAIQGHTAANGDLASEIYPTAPGEGIDVSFFTSEGHRYYYRVVRTLARIYIDTPRVTGVATPGRELTLVLRDADGGERGRAETTVDTNGNFAVELQDADGTPVDIAASDVLTIEATGETPTITVEPLSIDFSPGAAISGQAPADRAVELQLTLQDSSTFTVNLVADGDGAFRFTADDIPPRASWTLDDVRHVRATIETQRGHLIIAQAGELPGPTPGASTIYLPLASKSADLRSASLDATRTGPQPQLEPIGPANTAGWQPATTPRGTQLWQPVTPPALAVDGPADGR